MNLKKRILSLALLLALVFTISAQAITVRYSPGCLSLSFKGTTAVCYLSAISSNSDDEIEVVMKLWQGDECIKTWKASSNGSLILEKTKTVDKGKTYGLSADVTINGKSYPCDIVVGTCK